MNVLALLVHDGVNTPVVQRAGLLNVRIYKVVWDRQPGHIDSRVASDNVVPVVSRLRRLLGGRDNFESIEGGYRFLGRTVTLEDENTSSERETHVAPDEAVVAHAHGFSAPASGRVVGRDEEIAGALDQWLADRNRPLLIWGTPGIGKSTLALAVLNHKKTRDRFGERRFWLRCDGITSAADVKKAMASKWFGIAQAETFAVDGLIVQRLSEAPCALVMDNFETPHRADTMESEEWLRTLLAIDGLFLIVATQGYYQPGGIDWTKPIEPKLLSIDFARDLFCRITGRDAHRHDPRLDRLLEDMSGVPHAIELLAHQAVHTDELDALLTRWAAKGTPMLQRMGGPDRSTSLAAAYRFAIENPILDDAARTLLRALACLPMGAHEADCPVISGVESPWDAADMLIQAALVYREADRLRLLSPLRDFILREYPLPADEVKRVYDAYLKMITGRRALSIFDDDGAQVLADLSDEFENIQWAVETSLDSGDPAGIEAACRLVGLVSVGEFRAKNFLPRAVALAREIGDRAAEMACLVASAHFAYSQQENDEATSGFQMTLALSRSWGDPLNEGLCLLRLGELEFRSARYETAGRFTLEALAAFGTFDGPLSALGRANCHHNLAGFALECGVVRTAAEQAASALVLFKKAGHLRGEAKCLALAGKIAHELHQYENMQACFNEAISILEALGFPLPLAFCLFELGDIQEMWQQRQKARDCFQHALSLFRSAGHTDGETACRNALTVLPALE